MTVEGNALFDMRNSSGSQSVSRLHLENWTWKATSDPYVTSHVPVMFNRTNGNGYLHECKVSVSATAGTSSTGTRLTNRIIVSDSALAVQMHDFDNFQPNGNNASSSDGWNDTTISIDGNGTTTWAAGTAASQRWQFCTNVGVVLKNMEVTGAPGFNSGNGFNYLVFEDCTLPGSSAIYCVTTSNLVCFAGTTSDESARVNSGTVVTQSQLKDKSYLQQIGWLP